MSAEASQTAANGNFVTFYGRRFFRLSAPQLQFGFLSGAIVLYALWGTPTPDAPGMLEAVIALFLILSVGPAGLKQALCFSPDKPFWYGVGQILLLAGLSLPLLSGILHGHAPRAIIRDILPFIFMMIPVFHYPLFHKHPEFFKPLLTLLVCAGVLLGFRAVLDFMGRPFSFLFLSRDDELYYLANVPTVLFAALFLTGQALRTVAQAQRPRGVLEAVLYIPPILCTLIPLGLTLQRASIGIFILYTLGIMLWLFFRSPRKALLLVALLLGAFWPFIPVLQDLLLSLGYKTALVGVNMRGEEMRAVWKAVSYSPITVFFGKGWGAEFFSPAAGSVYATFTHSFLTSFLLKTGFLGLALAGAYISGLFYIFARRVFVVSPFLALALSGPLLIDLSLYASFKSLDFGLVLLLVCSAAEVASRSPLLYSKRDLQDTH